MANESIVQVQVVHDDRDALQAMIDQLVDERLIACGQVMGPIKSTFFWDGSVQHEDEWLALMKTSNGAVEDLVARLTELHSYDVPEILILDIGGGFVPYLDWVIERTNPESAGS